MYYILTLWWNYKLGFYGRQHDLVDHSLKKNNCVTNHHRHQPCRSLLLNNDITKCHLLLNSYFCTLPDCSVFSILCGFFFYVDSCLSVRRLSFQPWCFMIVFIFLLSATNHLLTFHLLLLTPIKSINKASALVKTRNMFNLLFLI